MDSGEDTDENDYGGSDEMILKRGRRGAFEIKSRLKPNFDINSRMRTSERGEKTPLTPQHIFMEQERKQEKRVRIAETKRSNGDLELPERKGSDKTSNATTFSLSPTPDWTSRRVSSAHELTESQRSAFREVFDLFDSNGGGTIDADELDSALNSVNISLTQDEICQVLSNMDRDGNGEIDFDEFLQLMTNTERFLETFATVQQQKNHETLLFEALTQFMKKSALHSLDEIVGYYHTKYKRAQAPHVVSHYAAGARLIGLTEKQLQKRMEFLRTQQVAAGESSPYAEPLIVICATKKRKKNNAHLQHIAQVAPTSNYIPIRRGWIKLKFNSASGNNNKRSQSQTDALVKEEKDMENKRAFPVFNANDIARRLLSTKKRKQSGWVSQRIKPMSVKLPAMPVSPIPTEKKKSIYRAKTSTAQSKKFPDIITIEDLPLIRKKVESAVKEYKKHQKRVKRVENEQHWHSLYPEDILCPMLREQFRKVFMAYMSQVR